jgi:site-specific DNA-methyltransferase (adenine-specific)/site-specific DNA-methyltransferase (cytosine-N4-specific)
MILEGDCFELIKEQPDNSVDLVITSPPYADIVNYGKNISIKKPNEYVDWILPLFNEIHRVLKPSGSFILNINDNCDKGLRNPFIYELIYRSQKETKLKFYDTYIWHKMNGIPNGSNKRFRNNTEFIFHFVKNQKELKFYMDRVLKEPAKATSDRAKYPWQPKGHGEIIDGERTEKNNIEYKPSLVRPDNVFRFPTAGLARDNTIRHPAPYHKELPEYFINLLTDEGDVVLDVFSGIGTTGLPCRDLNREYIGFELNEKYAEFSKKRLNGEELEKYVINQYDLEDNFIRSWNTITQIETTLGFDSHNHIEDCIRKGNETSYGYKWKLEKNDIINQYDLEGNFIQTFNTLLEIENYFGKPCVNNIKNILRGYRKNFTLWGFDWKLEKRL